MGKYGSCCSWAQVCRMEKEQIEHALKGELMCGETENGFEYAPADKEECDKFIIDAYTEACFQATKAFASGRAVDRYILEILNAKIEWKEMFRLMNEEEFESVGEFFDEMELNEDEDDEEDSEE
jgi:hypothetical protein